MLGWCPSSSSRWIGNLLQRHRRRQHRCQRTDVRSIDHRADSAVPHDGGIGTPPCFASYKLTRSLSLLAVDVQPDFFLAVGDHHISLGRSDDGGLPRGPRIKPSSRGSVDGVGPERFFDWRSTFPNEKGSPHSSQERAFRRAREEFRYRAGIGSQGEGY